MSPPKEDVLARIEEQEKALRDHVWKYVLWLTAFLVLGSLPHSKFQVLFKAGVWTALFCGLVLTYTWPFLLDKTSKATILSILAFHGVALFLCRPLLEHRGYRGIGLGLCVESVLAFFPIAWLDLRSQDRRAGEL